MTYRIRRAVPKDAAALHRLAALTFPLACPPGTTPADATDFVRRHLSEASFGDYLADRQRVVIAADDGEGELVGYTMVVLGDPADADVAAALQIRPTAELSKCYVLPGRHGTGLAAQLIQASMDAAVTAGAVGMWLGVNQENARALRFYEKHGFGRAGEKHFTVGSQVHDDFVLERALEL